MKRFVIVKSEDVSRYLRLFIRMILRLLLIVRQSSEKYGFFRVGHYASSVYFEGVGRGRLFLIKAFYVFACLSLCNASGLTVASLCLGRLCAQGGASWRYW